MSVDLKAMMANKQKVVTTLTRGIEMLFKKNKVRLVCVCVTVCKRKGGEGWNAVDR